MSHSLIAQREIDQRPRPLLDELQSLEKKMNPGTSGPQLGSPKIWRIGEAKISSLLKIE